MVLSPDEIYFTEFINEYGLVQLNDVPSNKHGNILDLMFCNFPQATTEVEKCDEVYDSDHTLIMFKICLHLEHCRPARRYAYDFKRADFRAIRSALLQCNLCDKVRMCDEVDNACKAWVKSVNEIISKYVPKVCVKNHCKLPWFDKEAVKLRNKKRVPGVH